MDETERIKWGKLFDNKPPLTPFLYGPRGDWKPDHTMDERN